MNKEITVDDVMAMQPCGFYNRDKIRLLIDEWEAQFGKKPTYADLEWFKENVEFFVDESLWIGRGDAFWLTWSYLEKRGVSFGEIRDRPETKNFDEFFDWAKARLEQTEGEK